MALSEEFLAHAGKLREALASNPALEEALLALTAAAHHAWPLLAVPAPVFLKHLVERLPGDGDPFTALVQTHAGDLYLACACSHGDEAAIRCFDESFISQISVYLGADAKHGVDDEIKQRLRARLLVSDANLLPQIATYSGRGPLGAWLRVTATREALRLRGPTAADESVIPESTGLASDPELDYLKAHYAEDLSAAFESTLAALPSRDGVILRLYYFDGMTADAIGALYRVSSRTVQRWISETREKILADTHRRLAERLGLPPSELEGLVGLLQSQIDVSILRFIDGISRSRT